MYVPHFVYPLIISGHLGCFHLLAIVNNAAMNIGIQIFVRVPAFNYFRYISRSEMAGSCVNSKFNFLRNCRTVFYSGCTILHSHQPCTECVSLCPHLRLLSSGLWRVFLGFVFYNSGPNGCEVESHCAFDLHFPDD